MRKGRALLAALLPLFAGCASYVTHKIEHPAISHGRLPDYFHENLAAQGFGKSSMRTTDGVRMAYWLGPPHVYDITETFTLLGDGPSYHWNMRLPEKPFDGSRLRARGSIVLLHPWEGEGAMLAGWAYHLASAGYVTVLPDLRSQGESDKAPVGYGPREGRDIAELVRDLRAKQQLPEPGFLMGVSYGATAAVFAASELGDVRGVITLEPYGNAADVIRRAPSTNLFGPRWLGSVIGASNMDAAIKRASTDLGVDLAHIDTAGALAHAPCTLILRGGNDPLVSAQTLKALTDASARVRYIELSGENHITLPLRTDRLLQPMLDWMQALAASPDTACPAFVPLPSSVRASGPRPQGITGGT
ncbi:alpha/beta hydrolase family protein [Dyella japonica]|uniref:alpha/beta hydrolase family protein n=1 Tax=Dyella japonica TaxID=231455 RepID=UPI000305B89E|nr:alpha/beta fold hydrolase [Dyella japonica]